MYKYETIIYWSEEDHLFLAEVPELPGYIAHGSLPAQTLSNLGDAIHLWLETAQEFELINSPNRPLGRR